MKPWTLLALRLLALWVVASALLAPSLRAQPRLAISGTSVSEGNTGTVQAVVTVTLTPAAGGDVTVRYESSQAQPPATGGADCRIGGVDFERPTGTLEFAPGVTSQIVSVTVCGDTAQEPDENFTVVLSNPVGADRHVAENGDDRRRRPAAAAVGAPHPLDRRRGVSRRECRQSPDGDR